MKSSTHKMAEAITAALGPIFHANPDYKTITEAIALTVASVAQSTPDKGNEEEELEIIMQIAANALNVFLNEEQTIQETKAEVLAKGIDGFAEMYGPVNGLAAINGGVSPEAYAEAEEFAGQDHSEESWANSSIHQEIARFEQENPNVGPDGDPGYNPDGPRAYL
jgi:hypothetical protein